MPLKLKDLTAVKVAAWLDDETKTRPTKAALAYRLLRAFLRWSAGHDDCKASVQLDAVGSRIAKDHVPRAKAKQDDCLQSEQLAAWFDAVKKINPPAVSAYLQGLLPPYGSRMRMPCKWLVYRIYLCTDYAAYSAPWLIGQKRLLAWWLKSWGTSQARLPKSTTAAATSTCYVCGMHGLKPGFWNRPASNSQKKAPVVCVL